MIKITKFSKQAVYINCDHIELIEQTPDTIITLSNGKRIMVEETPDVIIERIIDYRLRCAADPCNRLAKTDEENKAYLNEMFEKNDFTQKEGLKL